VGTCTVPTWPTATGEVSVPSTITVSGTLDGQMQRYNGTGSGINMDCSGADEQSSVDPLFDLAEGATIKNVILGKYAADGIHCRGNCTIQNVWWEDLCDDAATFLGSSSSMLATVDGGGARNGADKTFQHNGSGTVIIKNFYVQNVGKLYRSCGDCSSQYTRHSEFSNIVADTVNVQLAAVNTDYNDTATLSPLICVRGVKAVCGRYTNNTHVADGPDGTYCIYDTASVVTF
jgi:hypothetical protein